ncbi:SAM-dependent methyltransferase, partial [Propionibacterium freudenreichii]|nr:SAM-dependent methyltransferase [Propionibacterium freudenreichii]
RLLAWAHGAGATEVTASSSTWCYADDAARQLWGGTWAQRILDSSIAKQLTSSGMATRDELEQISQAWRHWAADPDGWFSLLHGEILIHV